MKGIELAKLLGLIILAAVILLVFIMVIGPAIGMGGNMNSRVQFEDFCTFWSLNGYAEKDPDSQIIRNEISHGTPGEFCPIVLKKDTSLTPTDIETCISCCKKEKIC